MPLDPKLRPCSRPILVDTYVPVTNRDLSDFAKLANLTTFGIRHYISDSEDELSAASLQNKFLLLCFTRDALSQRRSCVRKVFFQKHLACFQRLFNVIRNKNAIFGVSLHLSGAARFIMNEFET